MENMMEKKVFIPEGEVEWGRFYNQMKVPVMRKLQARGIGYHDAEDAYSEAITKAMGVNPKRHLEKPLAARTVDGWVNWLSLQARSIVHDAFALNCAWTPVPDDEPIVRDEMNEREKSEARSKERRIEGLYVELESNEKTTEAAIDENERYCLLSVMIESVVKESHVDSLAASAYREQVLNGWSPKLVAVRVFKISDTRALERKCNAIRMAKSRLDRRLREKVRSSIEFKQYFEAA